MSYDLYFWKQSTECSLPPETVLQRLSEQRTVEGIDSLPVETIVDRIKKEFPAIQEMGNSPIQFVWDDGPNGCFIAIPYSNYLCIESHQATTEVLNRLIEVSLELDCRLYDPQTGIRYVGE